MTATAKVPLSISVVVAPMNSWPSRLAVVPVRADAAMSRIPTPPMMTVRMVCKMAAVLVPTILMAVMKTETRIATASQEA